MGLLPRSASSNGSTLTFTSGSSRWTNVQSRGTDSAKWQPSAGTSSTQEALSLWPSSTTGTATTGNPWKQLGTLLDSLNTSDPSIGAFPGTREGSPTLTLDTGELQVTLDFPSLGTSYLDHGRYVRAGSTEPDQGDGAPMDTTAGTTTPTSGPSTRSTWRDSSPTSAPATSPQRTSAPSGFSKQEDVWWG